MGTQATKAGILDTLRRALHMTEIAGVVDVDTLGGIMSSGFNDMYRGGVVSLDMVWRILLNQEGVTKEVAAIPLLIFEGVGDQLGIQVELPEELRASPALLKLQEVARRVTREQGGFKIGIAETGEVGSFEVALQEEKWRAGEERREAHARRVREAKSGDIGEIAKGLAKEGPPDEHEPPRPPSKLKLIVAAGSMVVALAAAGIATFIILDPGAREMDASAYSGTLVLKDAVRDGANTSAVIDDSRWLKMTPNERVKVLTLLFDQMQEDGVRGLALKTEDGKLAGTAFVTDRGPAVRLY